MAYHHKENRFFYLWHNNDFLSSKHSFYLENLVFMYFLQYPQILKWNDDSPENIKEDS